MSDILSKKHEIMVAARQIMDSLRVIFEQPSIQIKQEANVAHSRRFAPSSSGSKKIQKRKGGKGKGSTVAAEGKGKAKETSSFKQLEESEMTLKVGTGDVISARAVGDAKLDHINLNRIERLVKNGLLSELEDNSLPPCESCLEGKMTKRFFTGKDDYSRYGYLYLMEHKSEALEKFKEYKAEVENLLIETAVHILNNVPSKSVSETPFELWRGRKPSLSHFRIWGCPAHLLVTNPKKLEPHSSGGVVSQPNNYLGLTKTQVVIPDDGVEDPLSYKQAMNDVDIDQWVKAMDLEMESMYFNSVWELVDLPEGPAFMNDNLEESIFMSQPEGFITQGQEQKVCKLNRSIYGLKQASRSWNIRNDVGYLTSSPIPNKRFRKGTICSWDPNHKGSHGVHLSKEQCPKIPQEVGIVSRYQSNPGLDH
ncbi:putative polyprotein [Cucumis melo var. makuwa]|uniref:Putative polyprotein n=1 Tax=Cucumis melo var. makuwa TaxID=1194695 RepID=A0A5D3C7J7_CUCMM|nr:putative polyprotein [Cucumis melo var. makuwa]